MTEGKNNNKRLRLTCMGIGYGFIVGHVLYLFTASVIFILTSQILHLNAYLSFVISSTLMFGIWGLLV